MSVNELQRHQVLEWLIEQAGPERAAIMMELLPPVGWGDIATKADLDALESQLRVEMRGGFAELRGDIQASNAELLYKLFFGLVASNATLVGLVFAAVRLG